MIPPASTQAWAAKGGAAAPPRTRQIRTGPRHWLGCSERAGQRRKSRARRARRSLVDFCAVDDHVVEVVVRGVVERATTGDQMQLGVGYRAEHRGGGEVGLRVLMHAGDPEDGEPAVR